MDKDFKGMKAGWTLGWIGSTLWLGILIITHLSHGELQLAITTLALYGVCITYIMKFTPWNFPDTAYWKLILPFLIPCLSSAAWAMSNSGELGKLLHNKWQLLILLPIFSPLLIFGSRTWNKTLEEHQKYQETLEEIDHEESLTPHQ